MNKYTLQNNMLVVKGQDKSIFKVEILEIKNNFFCRNSPCPQQKNIKQWLWKRIYNIGTFKAL